MSRRHCFGVLACLVAVFVFPGPSRAESRPAFGPGRPARCLIEVKEVHYVGGPCLFIPIGKDGSFRITTRRGLGAEVDIYGGETPRAAWSGARGHAPDAIRIGDGALQNGCWLGDGGSALVCAWDKGAHVYLGPSLVEGGTHAVPTVQWGERLGMFSDVVASSGLDTGHAVIVAERDVRGAAAWCRSNNDFSQHCIDEVMHPEPHDRLRKTIEANCRTKVFTDLWEERRKYLGDKRMLDLASNEEVMASPADNYGISLSAIEALCPKTLEKPARP